jgi:hypothetical protein
LEQSPVIDWALHRCIFLFSLTSGPKPLLIVFI